VVCEKPPCSTPGSVRCGTVDCPIARAVCLPEGEGKEPAFRCVPRESLAALGIELDHRRGLFCDDTADCSAGELCCANERTSYRSGQRCQKAPCADHEVCLDRGSCASGFVCVAPRERDSSSGVCVTDARVQCGKIRCTPERPICCWDDDRKRATCVARDEPCPEWPETASGPTLRLECTSPADCRGYRCCLSMAQSFCAGNCDDPGPWLCRTRADCDPILENFHGQGKFLGCVNRGLPPGAKVCDYSDE
jgi:hypothetical protein